MFSLIGSLAWAQASEGGPDALPTPQLRATRMLQEALPAVTTPVYIEADRLSGQNGLQSQFEGKVELRRAGSTLRADLLQYDHLSDLARVQGHVALNRAGNTYTGEQGELYVDAFAGQLLRPTYRLLATGANGQAERLTFIDPNRSVAEEADYTTCRRPPPKADGTPGTPAWRLRARELEIDTEAQEGLARGAVLEFYGLPVLPLPSMTFPLGGQRKSGWLPPTVGLSNTGGLELALPYYWDIAPNRDLLITPDVMSKRGVDVTGEFRYLENDYRGRLRATLMPRDRLRDGDTRWGYSLQHSGTITTGLSSVGNLGLNLNLNRVSDDRYWKDFPRTGLTFTDRLLPSDATLNWARGDFSLMARALKWQTLQDPDSPIVPPYDRLPQIQGRYVRSAWNGLDLLAEADYTRFQADRALTLQPNGQRAYLLAQASYPWLRPGAFVTPTLRLHTTRYDFSDNLSDGTRSASRTLPTFTLDSGLVFERPTRLFGRALTQTLEPRLYYTYTPYRDQSALPNYDSAAYDFNFASIYTDNAFVGNDRISDNNLLTAGVTTRFLDASSGAENASFAIAQRYRFSPQRVTLPGGTAENRGWSDIMLGARLAWNPRWSLEAVTQYNLDSHRSVRSTVGARYSPSPYRTVSVAYRLQRGQSEQVDIGWQWPLNDLWGDKGRDLGPGRGQGGGRWYSVGRLNYDLQNRRRADTIIGLEYDGCCWIGRVVLEQLQSTLSTATKRVLFQIEFVNLARVGSSPLQSLRENIPRYQHLREQVSTPSRFTNYD